MRYFLCLILNFARQRILSEEYRDFIVSSRGGRIDFQVPEEKLCRQRTQAGYDVIYIDQPLADPIGFERFPYSSVPKCYALLDMEAMNQAGITQVQNYPTLELMGENVMIGFVDTGIDYTIRCSVLWMEAQGLQPSGIRPYRME